MAFPKQIAHQSRKNSRPRTRSPFKHSQTFNSEQKHRRRRAREATRRPIHRHHLFHFSVALQPHIFSSKARRSSRSGKSARLVHSARHSSGQVSSSVQCHCPRPILGGMPRPIIPAGGGGGGCAKTVGGAPRPKIGTFCGRPGGGTKPAQVWIKWLCK